MNFDDTIVPEGVSEEEAPILTREETGYDVFPEEKSNEPDLSKVDTMLLSSDWIEGDIHSRPEMADNAFSLIADTVEKSVGMKVRIPVVRDGEKTFEEVAIHDTYGKLNKHGRDYLNKARQALEIAAIHPDGAVAVDSFTGEAGAASWVNDFMANKPEKEHDMFPQFDDWMKDATALDTGDFKAGLTWEKYVDFLKADGNGTPFDPDDKDLKEEFYKTLRRSTFDTSLMDENKIIEVIDGAPVINPVNMSEIDKVEASINNLKGFSKASKRMMLLDYHQKVEEQIVDYARVFSAADAGPIEAVFNRPLMQELEAHLQTGKPSIDFLRANKERFSRDSYGKTSEIISTLRDAVIATGTGATWLVGAGLDKIPGIDGAGEVMGRPAELWGALAEESASAYRNPTAFQVGSIDIKRRDLTELLGQVGSFLAIGGVANLTTRSIGLTAAREALAAGKAGTGMMARVASGEAAGARAVVATEAQLSKVVGEKTAKFLTAAGTDTTAYLGGVQASGMSFGKTYNQVLEQTGDADAAYKAASIQGVSDGLSALIATGVMNRVAPGMERLLGGSGKVEGSLIQSIKAARASTAGKAGMLQAKEALETLTPELRKQFAKDIAASVRKGSSAAGLRSFGAVKDVFAEGVEEGLDEALSDALQVVLDDSKSWSEGDWGNIHDNFRDYMKAAVLGALGGGAGVSVSMAANSFGQPKVDRKKVIEQAVKEPWKLIKANVEKFSNHDQLVSLGSEAKVVKLSEMLASDKFSTKEKSEALVSLALEGSVRDAADLSMDEPINTLDEPGEAAPAAVVDDGTLSVDPEDAETGQKIVQMGYKAPTGTEWKKGLKTAEGPGFRVASDLASETKLYPVSIGDDSYVGARLETIDKKTGVVTSRYVGQDEAIELISKAGFGSEARRGNHATLFKQAKETQTKNDDTNASEAIESGWVSPASKSVESKRDQARSTSKPAEGSGETKGTNSVPADAEVPTQESEGDGAGEAATIGSNPEADSDWGAEPGGIEPAASEAQPAGVAPKQAAADKANLQALDKVAETSTEPSPDARYVVRKEQVKGNEDKNGGRWLIDGSNYTYVPAKGKTLKLTVQDVLLIEGQPDEVLVLHNIQGGQLNFMKVNAGGLGINMQESSETKLLQDRWSATRLDKAANALAPLLQTLMKGNLDKKDLAAFKKAFELVVATVAPGAKPVYSILKAEAGDSHFMQTNAQETEKEGVSLVMQVDLERTANVLRAYLGEANPSNKDYERVISLEAARLLSKWVDEEQIHILTMGKEFKVEEMESFYREVLAETKSPFHRYLLDTVKERFPSIDMNGEWQEAVKAETNGEYIVGSELLRKLFQVMMTGSYSEEATNDARRLSQALNGDTAKSGFMRTLSELLRRYTKRIAELLHFKAIQGKLPDSQHELLARLKRVYNEANLNGDVDLVKGKGKLAVKTRLRILSASNKIETNKISKLHSNALLKLRDDLRMDFTSIALDDYVVVSDDMELGLHPDIKAHIQRNPDRFDLKAIEDALEALNAEESYQKAWSEMDIAYQSLQMATEDLTFNPLALFEKGKEFDKSGVMALILAGAPKTTGDNALVRAAKAKLKEVRGKQKLLKKAIEFETKARIEALDPSNAKDRRELLARGRNLGWVMRSEDFQEGGRFESYSLFKEKLVRATRLRMRNAPVYLDPIAVAEDPDVSGWVDLKALNEQEQELKGLLAEIEEVTSPEQASNETLQNRTVFGNEGAERVGNQLRRSMEGVDMEVARERYRQFEEWQKALEEFNACASNVKRRAIGDFQDYFSKDYGLAFQNTRFTAVSGMEARPDFGPRVDPVEEAVTASDALGYEFIPAKSAKGRLPGEGRPRNPGKEHSTLEAIEMVEAHSRVINSNAAFVGRKGWSDYFLAKSLGELPGDFDHVKYMAGAGFSFFGELNQYDRMEFESADSAFRSFDGFDEMFGMQRRLKADEPLTQDKLNGFITYIQKARNWVDDVRSRVDTDRMILEMNGKQTPAARLALLLKPVLDELTNYLDQNANTFATALAGHVYYDSTKPFGEAFERNEDGSLKLKPTASGQTSLDVVYASLKESLDPNAKSSIFAYMVEAQLAASTAVKLTAKTVREFNNKRHRDNTEESSVRVIRDLAYVPDNPDLLALRDSFIDLPTHRNMLFQLGYQEKDNDYHVTSLHAVELLENYRKINRGSREAFLTAKPKQKRKKTFVDGEEVFPDPLYDEDGNPIGVQQPVSQTGLPIVDQTALVQTYDNRGENGEPVSKFDSGEQGADVDAFANQLFTEGSTGLDQLKRQAEKEAVSMKIWLTGAMDFIGYRSGSVNGSVEDSQEFVRRMQVKMSTGEGSVGGLVETAIQGLFPVRSKQSEEAFQLLVSDFYDKNPQWQLRPDEVGRDFNAEAFIVDLIEFKAAFERDAVERARIKNEEPIAQAASVVESAEGIVEEEKESILRLLKRGVEKGGFAVYDTRQVGMDDMFLTSNPVVSLLATNAIGRTLIVRPTGNQDSVSDAKVGLRFFPGKEGEPHVLYAPEQGTSTFDQQVVLGQVLSLMAQDKESADLIVSLAKGARDAIAPAFDAELVTEVIRQRMEPVRQVKAIIQKRLQLLEKPRKKGEKHSVASDEAVAYEPSLSDKLKAQIESLDKFGQRKANRLLESHYVKLARDIGSNQIMEGEIGSGGIASDIGLIVNLLTDPHYKRAFDSSYTGGDVHLNHDLPEQADLALQTALQRITDYAGEQNPFYEESVSGAAMDRMADMLTNPDLTLDEEIEKGEAEDSKAPVYEAFKLNDENEIEDEEESADPASYEDAQTALITLLNPDRMKPATWEGTIPPAESFLYNHLAQLVARSKDLNLQLEPFTETKEQSTKDILDGLDSNDLAEPIFNERNRPTTKQERARSIFIGQAINLVSPRGPGGAMATAAMNYNRQRTESAAWLSRMPGVSPLIEMEAKKVIGEKLKLSPTATSFPLVSTTIPLSEGMLESMKASLPFYQEEEDAVKRMLTKMDEDQRMLVKQLEDARAILDKPVGFDESLFVNSDLEGRAIREQMSTLVVNLAGLSSFKVRTIAEQEAALLMESVREQLKDRYAKLYPSMTASMTQLQRLVRERDEIQSSFLSKPQEQARLDDLPELINQEIEALNKYTAVLNSMVSAELNKRLKSMGLPERTRSIMRPIGISAGAVSMADLVALQSRLGFGPTIAREAFIEELLPRISEEFLDDFNKGSGFKVGKNSKKRGKPGEEVTDRSKLYEFIRKAEGLTNEEIITFLDQQIALEGNEITTPFSKVIRSLALNTVEAKAIIESKAMTAEQRSEREHAQALIDEAKAGLEELAKVRDVKMKSDGTLFVGRFRYNIDKRGVDGRLLGLNVALAITAPEMMPPSSSESQKRYKDRTEAWKNSEEARKQWFIRSQALAGALSRMSEDRVDEIYKKLRGELDRSSTFDPAVMVNESISRVEIENQIIKDRWAEGQRVADAVSKVEGDKLVRRGLSTEALALYAEPGKMFFTATKGTKQTKRLKSYLAPSNLEARQKLIGTLFDDMDGNPVALMHQDAAALLRQAFPERVTAKNSGRSVAGIVFRALSPSIGNPGFMIDPTKDAAWTGDFATTNGQKLTSAEAGKLFSAKYRKHLLDYLNQDRSTKIEEKGAATTQSLHLFSSLIEKLAHAYVNPKLSAKLKAEVAEVLRKIEHVGGFRNDDAMMELNLIPVFSRVFAELESEFIMDKLVSGLSIHDEGTSLTLMKYAHHQDARIRSRFIRDHQARETAMHLQAFLEQGLDGNTGRDGHQIAHKAAQDKIAIAAKEVGPKAMDHAIGYMLAQLDGLNDRSGMSLTQALDSWYQDIKVGIKDLDRLDLAQKVQWKGKTSRFFNANHVELIRDIPLVKDLVKALKDSGAMSNMGTVMTDSESPTDTDTRDASSRLAIRQLKEALISKATSGKVDQVKAYADTIHDTLLDAYNATMVTRAMLSKTKADPKDTEGQEHDAWAHNERSPKKPTYSSVPLRRAYAANPKTGHLRVPKEGKYIEDPADVVSINDSAFFGGYGRHEDNRREASVLRPLALNGLAAPFFILEDSLYRTNVTPNYEVLRHLLGKVENQSGVPVVGKSMMMSPEMRQSAAWRNGQGARYKVALAAVATEIENNIFNDSQIGVVQTGFAQLANFLASTFMVRSLASVQQLTNQTIPPVTFFVVKKLATGQWREAADFLSILSKTVSSMSIGAVVSPSTVFGPHEGMTEFHHRVAEFVKNTSPYVYLRGFDGQDMSRNALRHQTRHGNNKAKAYAGRMVKEYENLGEVFLNSTIGFGERIVARSIFMAELMSELRRHNGKDITVEQLLEMKAGDLPIVAKQMARVKVSDMMGQSDISKKSKMFQSHSQSPVWSSLWKSLVRFSNHPATTASNMVAFLPGLRSADPQTRKEAMENIIGTIGQNSMFHFTKIHVLIPLVAYLFYSLGGDDEDEAMRKAQETADGILAREDGDNEATAFMKEITFGSKKQLFQDWKSADASRGSAWAELGSKVAMEFAQATLVVGVLAGYAPVSGMMRPVANDASSEIAAMLMDGEAAEAWYERDGIGVREHQGNAIETAANLTAPTAVVYDAGDALKMSIEGAGAGARPFDVAAYLVSEFVPFMRDYRSARKQVLREHLQED